MAFSASVLNDLRLKRCLYWQQLRCTGKSSRKGTGFEQPIEPHQHWHVDVSYINLSGSSLLTI